MAEEYLYELQEQLRLYEDLTLKNSEFDSWLNEVSVFLNAENPAIGDLETLRAQIDQSKVQYNSPYR